MMWQNCYGWVQDDHIFQRHLTVNSMPYSPLRKFDAPLKKCRLECDLYQESRVFFDNVTNDLNTQSMFLVTTFISPQQSSVLT